MGNEIKECYSCSQHIFSYVLLTVHLDAILGNDQLDALFLNVFIYVEA
jgi:hypothetical protein